MLIKFFETLILIIIMKIPFVYEKLQDKNGFFQSSIIVILQGLAFAIYTLLLSIQKWISSKVSIQVKILNDFYNTNFSVIFLGTKEQTRDFERKLKIEIKIKYICNISTWFIKKAIKGVYLFLELERDDITITSKDRYVTQTYRGIKVSLEDIMLNHIAKSNKTNIDLQIYAYISLTDIDLVNNNEELIIYPQFLDFEGKNIKIFKRIFFKSSVENYKFKLKVAEKKEGEN